MSSFFIAFNRQANYPHKLVALTKFGKYLQQYSITDAALSGVNDELMVHNFFDL